jgi:hypothetical protein
MNIFCQNRKILLVSLFLMSIFLLPKALAIAGPQVYIFEDVANDYWANGTGKLSTVSKTGSVRVSVPNNGDVLQYVRVNLTETNLSRTNMINKTAYRNVITSYPTTNSTTALYVNLTGPTPSTSYSIINDTVSPTINMSVEYKNIHGGGRDLYSEGNVMSAVNNVELNFTLRNPSGTTGMTGVTVAIQFERDANVAADSLSVISAPVATSGAAARVDTDSDGYYDRVTWTGDLSTSSTVNITVNATIQRGVNYAGGVTSMDLDVGTNGPIANKGMNASFFSSSTLTGITVESRFTRGSIRQGIDMKQNASNSWGIRGFIENVAGSSVTNGYNLTYNISEWRMYSVNTGTGAPFSSPNQTGSFNKTATSHLLLIGDGRLYTTDSVRSYNPSWYETGSATKPYFAVYFDWQVVWDTDRNNIYRGYVNTTLDLPTLYMIDMANTKAWPSGSISPDTGGDVLTIEDNTTFTGNSNAAASFMEIFSVIPANTSTGSFHGSFEIDNNSIILYFTNASGTFRMSVTNPYVNYTIINVSQAGTYNGSINLTIWDVSQARLYNSPDRLNQNLTSSDNRFSMSFHVISNSSMTTGDAYSYSGNTTMKTRSGTKLTEVQPVQTLTVTAKRLTGYKDLIIYDPSQPTWVNGTIRISAEVGPADEITGIKFMDYIPNGTNFATSAVTVRFYDSSWNTWTNGVEYDITNNGTKTLSDGTVVTAYEYINHTAADGTFQLKNGWIIEVSYRINITQEGVWELPVEMFALDPITGQLIKFTAYAFVKVEIPPEAMSFVITEGEFSPAKRVVVGNPAMWVKTFDVYNPNSRPITGSFETEVVEDAINFYVSYYDNDGKRVEEQVRETNSGGARKITWESKFGPQETRSYEIKTFTPPILEIDRDVAVLEKVGNNMVKLKMDIFLKNFAKETYKNVVLNIPISYDKIMEVRDGFGKLLQFTGDKQTTTVMIGEMKAEGDGLSTVTIIYKESYPLVIVTPDRDKYDLNSPVGLEILVINGGEEVDYPYLEIEVYTEDMDIVYASVQKLNGMKPLEKTDFYEKFVIPSQAPAGKYVASVRFREDFTFLASATGNFIVTGVPGGAIPEALQVVLLLCVTGLLVYFSQKRLKEVKGINNRLRGI